MLKYRIRGKLCTKEKYDIHQIRLANLEKGRVPTVKTSTPKEASKRSLSACGEWEDVPTPKTPKRSCEEQENIIEDEEDVDEVEVEDASEKEFAVRGRRIFEPWENFKQMWCCKCKEALNGQYTEKEERRGLGCIWWIRCHKCSVINIVTSGKMHAGARERASLFDVNAKAVMGVTSAGCSYAHFNALIATLNMPNLDRKTFKRYERKEVGPSLEKVAKQSCEEAAREERELTIRNKTVIEQILPDHLKDGFIVLEELAEDCPVTFDLVVRIMVSYDMGWSKRGSGSNYDSLNGYGWLCGYFTGKVLDYNQCNRKCKACDMGSPQSEHDCRVNYYGSAKGMEAHTAKKLVTNSDILKSQNLQVGVLVMDDDSSSIAACRSAADHEIVKQSDKNHTARGVSKTLFGMQKAHRELFPDAIRYLHRCFTYALSQNKGDSVAMGVALRAIPLHAFNDHTICGNWCGYKKDPDNYDHSVIPGGFTDPNLKNDLIDVFNKLANNATKFSAGASSNVNESLNSMMARKAPKSNCYSMSESADFRLSAVVGKKNLGESYSQKSLLESNLSPGIPYHKKYIQDVDKKTSIRQQLYKLPETKKKRIDNTRGRTLLRNVTEKKEGTTYESQMGLFEEDGIGLLPDIPEENITLEGVGIGEGGEEIKRVVLFDLESNGFTGGILQIGAICGGCNFSCYIKPKGPISSEVTSVTKLTTSGGQLYKGTQLVPTVSLQAAMQQFVNYLTSLKKIVYLCAHNLAFDGPKLLKAVCECNLEDEFLAVVKGMSCSLKIIRKMKLKTEKNKIEVLATSLGIPYVDGHDALSDTYMLGLIIKKLEISDELIITSSTDAYNLIQKYKADEILNDKCRQFLSDCQQNVSQENFPVGKEIVKKIVSSNISVACLQKASTISKQELRQLLLPTRVMGTTVDKLYGFFRASHKEVQAQVQEQVQAVPAPLPQPNPPAPHTPERASSPDLVLEYLSNGQELTYRQLPLL